MARFQRTLMILVRVLCALAVLASAGFCIMVFARFPLSYDKEALLATATPTTLTDAEGQLIPTGTLSVYSADLSDVPQTILDVFVAAEDQRFYEHAGVDLVRVAGALVANLKSGDRSQGASTITQQLIKNKLLSPEKSYLRKAVEALFALQVEQDLGKEEILLLYLESAYFGKGAYGLSQAAWAYFSKSAEELTLTEAAALAATLKAPSSYAPHISQERNRQRREYILNTMAEEGFISQAEADEAIAQPLELRPASILSKASWYADAALEEAASLLGVEYDQLKSGGYRIETNLNMEIQEQLNALFQEDALFPASASDGTACESAIVVLDTSSARVLALVGGREYAFERGFNRAVDMRRQPGSALKPIAVYAPALSRRFVTASTELLDEPTDFDGYRPRNYGDSYNGLVTLRTAAALSLNVPAVKLLDAMGPYAGYESLRRFGIEPDRSDTGLSLAVGSMTYGVSPLSLGAAYCALGNGGLYNTPSFVRAIYGHDGTLLYSHTSDASQAVDAPSAYVTTSLLQSAAAWGTAKKLSSLSIPIAAKTGTVGMEQGEGNRDAWCAAYTPDYSICCWMGFDLPDEDHALPSSVTGGGLPTSLVQRLFENLPNSGRAFEQPEGVVWVNTAPFWEEAKYEVYLEGTQPEPSGWPLFDWDWPFVRPTPAPEEEEPSPSALPTATPQAEDDAPWEGDGTAEPNPEPTEETPLPAFPFPPLEEEAETANE